MQIVISDIRNYMSNSDFSRGQIYFIQGRVTQYLIKSDSYIELTV